MMPKFIGDDSLIARVNDVEGRMYRQSNELGKLNKAVRKYKAENAKLRELMRDTYDCICEMYRYMDGRYACEDAEADDAYGPILRRMRELGIEAE